MSKKQPPTEAEMRERLEEIAVEACIDTSDTTEPLDELIDRIRFGLQEELASLSNHFGELEDELDEFEDIIAEKKPQSKTEQST